jgi:hypothetical protein
MDIGSILLIFGILLLTVLYISQPLTRKQATLVSEEEREYSSLLADRDRVLKTLQDLDFDYTLGKIPEERYPIERSALLQRGAEILQQLDQYKGQKIKDLTHVSLEAELGTVEKGPAVLQPQSLADDDLETMIANRLRAREGRSNGFCPQCGHAVQKSDRFCPKCGHALRNSQ